MPEIFKSYDPLVEKARNFHWGDGGLVRPEDWDSFFKLNKRNRARYLGARDNCDVVESLGKDPNYGPEYQIVRYGSVNFWYGFLKSEMVGTKKFESFGAPINLKEFGGLGNHDEGWVPERGFVSAQGPATYHAYTLPRQIIDIVKISSKKYKKDKGAVSSQLFQAIDSVLTSPNLDAAVLRLALHSRKLGYSVEEIRKRIFDSGYKKELPEKYWSPIHERISALLNSKGL